jgi:hypothetical protein
MSTEDIEKCIQEKSLSIDVADKYLKIYIADIDWKVHITSLWRNAMNKTKNEDAAKDYIKRAISCATLLPVMENTPIPNPPSNLLFWCTSWNQFEKYDWFDMFIEVLTQDLKVIEKRNKLIQSGVLSRIDVSPMTRQAFNWIYEKHSSTEAENSLSKEKFTNIVRVYGGAIVCNMFVNHKINVDKIYNWRTGYFFEKEIHKVYTIDQINKIKKAEFNKINSKYINLTQNSMGA